MTRRFIITIDGPNAVGKTETAQALARLLNYKHINTGAIYRAVAYDALAKHLSVHDVDGLLEIIHRIRIDFDTQSSAILVNGRDLTRELYTAGTLSFTSEIAQLPQVRRALLAVQRQQAEGGGAVAEGRDTGTIVFPDADWKFYFDAADWRKAERVYELLSPEERLRYPSKASIIQYIQEIDQRDLTRESSPLRRADDALFHDTTHSPTPEHDAHILFHYIFHAQDILQNTEILRNKLAGR